MQVVLLAAGQATRLRPLTDDRPKCLLEVGGRTILSRAVGQLLARGLERFTIVDGYRGGMIRQALGEEFPGVDFRFVRNERYATTNNAWSLLLAEFHPAGPMLLLDSDIVFDGGVLDLMLAHPAPDRLAMRTEGEIGAEEMKVRIGAGSRVLGIGKELAPSASAGESVGIEIFDAAFVAGLWTVLRRRLLTENRVGEYYEDAFLELIEGGREVTAVDIGGLACREIDTVADLAAAQREFGHA